MIGISLDLGGASFVAFDQHAAPVPVEGHRAVKNSGLPGITCSGAWTWDDRLLGFTRAAGLQSCQRAALACP